MNQTTPNEIDATVTAFCCDQLGGNPRYIDVAPLEGCNPGVCFLNVWDTVKRLGGKAIYGWIVWYDPKAIIEGEYHAVWEKPDGTWVDITPTPDGEKRIAFVATGETPNDLTRQLQEAIERKLANPKLPPVLGPLYATPNKRKYL